MPRPRRAADHLTGLERHSLKICPEHDCRGVFADRQIAAAGVPRRPAQAVAWRWLRERGRYRCAAIESNERWNHAVERSCPGRRPSRPSRRPSRPSRRPSRPSRRPSRPSRRPSRPSRRPSRPALAAGRQHRPARPMPVRPGRPRSCRLGKLAHGTSAERAADTRSCRIARCVLAYLCGGLYIANACEDRQLNPVDPIQNAPNDALMFVKGVG
jgi:hypothetical protein